MTDNDYYAQASQVSKARGASGYFSAPSDSHDPNLFNDDVLKHEVRFHIINTLEHWLESQGLNSPSQWLNTWITGSGITSQWDADRGNGDLDVMYSAKPDEFRQANPDLAYYTNEMLADRFNGEAYSTLWSQEAHTVFGTREYEVTYYWITTDSIEGIHPYAAYDVRLDRWVVHPPVLPEDPRTLYPADWFRTADHDRTAAYAIADTYNNAVGDLGQFSTYSPRYTDAQAAMARAITQASQMFSEIHGDRHNAFSAQGQGYGDWYNFRWQRSKETGVIDILQHVANAGKVSNIAQDKVIPADEAMRTALQWRNNRG